MPKFENHILIDRPIFDVFKFMGDFTNDPQWRGVRGVGITSGDPIRPGSMVAMTRPLMGRKGFMNGDVVEYDRNKKIEMKGSFWGFPFVYTATFERRGQQTNIIEIFDVRTRWMVWFALFFNLSLGKTLARELANLKQVLESHGDKKLV